MDVIQKVFKPANALIVTTRLFGRDARVAKDADDAITRYAATGAPESSVERVKLKAWLEVETFLCTEYRYVLSPSEFRTHRLSCPRGVRTSPS